MAEEASGYLRRVAQCDARGDHDEAINELARGTKAGDPQCTRALGLRLLVGDRAPLLPTEGLRFLGDACRMGLPEAAARAAGVLALGANQPANWPLALEWLCVSAAGGWLPACEQLLALCEDRELAGSGAAALATAGAGGAGVAVDWRRVAAAVRLNHWRTSPPANVLSDDPRVSSFTGFLPPALCRFFYGLAVGRLERARVYDPDNRQDIVVQDRNNTLASFNVHTVELAHVLLQARMSAACGVSERHMEAPSVLHYAPGEQIENHYDFVNPNTTKDYAGEIARNGQRVITFLAYLNDDYDGGETAFPKLGFSYKGRCGDALYFVNALPDDSPDLRMQHAGRPTTRGEKWIITQFVRSRPTR